MFPPTFSESKNNEMPIIDSTEELNLYLRGQLSKLTRNITYSVLGSFIFLLLILLFHAMTVKKNLDSSPWIELFRDGFLILSGILTTLIGYYFGNRNSDLAQEQIQNLTKKNQRILSELSSLNPTISEEANDIEPIGDINLETPEETSLENDNTHFTAIEDIN